MKTKLIMMLPVIFLTMIWGSCKDDKVAEPAIEITELGYNNTGVAYIGGGLGVKANVGAQGLIGNIRVEVDKGSGKSAAGFNAVWSFDSVYTGNYSGLLDTVFSEMISIPEDADTGTYRFYIRVEDLEGGQASDEDFFRLDYGKKLVLPL